MSLEHTRRALERALEAAETLGLETTDAQDVARTIEEREGYPSELYVLGLVGGTGVGKSSLLNALAGVEISPTGVRRPTTRSPVALLPAGHEQDAAPLLEWLGGAETAIRTTEGPAVAIVDLPDLDSIEPGHAARVDAVLPRIDAVLWVTDPEKYDDAILHDRYLLRWMPRLAHQAIIVNKADRLAPDDMQRVCDDLRRHLQEEGLPEVPVLSVSAHADTEPLRAWLLEGASAKVVVRARLRQAALDAIGRLAAAAGVVGTSAPDPLMASGLQAAAAASTSEALLELVGPEGLRAQTAAAVRAEADRTGGGPIQRVRQLLERGSGVSAQRADPEGYLRRWRERGSLDRAVAPVRQGLLAAAAPLPPGVRAGLLANIDQAGIAEQLGAGVDAAVSGPALADGRPGSRLWPLIGLLQLAATAAVAAGVIWLVVLLASFGATPVGTIELPLLGAMPTPAVLIIGGALFAFLLDRLLRWQAGRLGRGWADSILEDVAHRVSGIAADVFVARLAPTSEARSALWASLEEMRRPMGE